MKLTPEEELTIKTYDVHAEAWVSEHSSSGFWAEEMKIFRELLPEGRIIEIGSGGGRDAKELIEMGYNYVGIDASEGLLKQARKVNPNATLEHKSVYDLDYPENYFNGFWTSATLLHIPKSA